jgi:CBS domain-containing protein
MPERTVFQSLTQRHVVTLPRHASVWEAACVMTKAKSSNVLITDSSGSMLGILTEHDLITRVLAKAMNPQTTQVSDVMTPNPQTIGPDMRVAEAVLMMIERGFRHLPIVSPSNKTLGVFSVADALPREIGDAVSLAEFNDQVNDALG